MKRENRQTRGGNRKTRTIYLVVQKNHESIFRDASDISIVDDSSNRPY